MKRFSDTVFMETIRPETLTDDDEFESFVDCVLMPAQLKKDNRYES